MFTWTVYWHYMVFETTQSISELNWLNRSFDQRVDKKTLLHEFSSENKLSMHNNKLKYNFKRSDSCQNLKLILTTILILRENILLYWDLRENTLATHSLTHILIHSILLLKSKTSPTFYYGIYINFNR
jgi:hypothetical protein